MQKEEDQMLPFIPDLPLFYTLSYNKNLQGFPIPA